MEHSSSSASVSGGSSPQQEVILQCDDLLDLIAKTKTNQEYDDPFGHPPPPKIASVLKLSSTVTTAFPKNQNNQAIQPTEETTTHYYLVIGYSSHCVGAQVFVLQQQQQSSSSSSEEQHNNHVWDASRPRIVFEEADVRHVGVVIRSRNEPQNRHVLHPKTKNIRKTVSWTQNRVQIIVATNSNNNSNSSSSQLLCAVEMTLGWNGFGVDPVCPVAMPSGLGDVLEIVVQDDTGIVALSYTNGTIVQLPASALTYKMIKKDDDDSDDDDDGELLDNTKTTTSILWDSNIVKVQVQLPPSANVEGGGDEYHILPLLKSSSNNNAAAVVAPCTHISDTIRSTLEACTLQSAHTLNDEVKNKSRSRISAALVYPTEKPEALGDSPTLAVYTTNTTSSSLTAGPNPNDGSDYNNDDDNAATAEDGDARDSELLSVAMGATSTLFRGVSSVLGFRSTTSKSASLTPNEKKFKPTNKTTNDNNNNNNNNISSPPRQLLGPLYQPPSAILTSSGMEYHDSPRRLVSVKCSVNNNNMILATDSLGRVLVWDTVPTFSVRTIFKGWREAQVICFSDTAASGSGDNNTSSCGNNNFLALYSPVRKSLQVWNCDTCTTVTTRSNIPHHPQIQLVSSSDERCFILQPLHSSKGVKFILKEIIPSLELSTSIPGVSSSSSLKSMMTSPLQSPSSRNNNNNHNHIQLQLLQQILSSQENPLDQVLEIVSSIENPHEFLTVIPLVASSTGGGNNVKLLQMVLNHAQQLQKDLVDEKEKEEEDNDNNNNDDELQSCLHYHQQLIQVYQTIVDFEVHQKEKHLLFDEEEGDERAQPKSTWAMEGLSWMATHAQVMTSSSQKSLSSPLSSPLSSDTVLSFSQLCQACELQTNNKNKNKNNNNNKKKNCTIVFKDSYRTRRPLLQHLFRPLLHDTFSYVTLTNALEEMGLLNDDSNEDALLESYFSEWYLHCHTGKVSNLAKVSLLQVNSNIARWLKSRVAASVDARLEKEHVGKDTILLSTVYHDWIQNCEQQNLTEAFLLAATCRDAISSVCQKREVRTYGKVYNQNVLQPWETLLKRLRLLIFVQLRLHTSDENDAFRLEAPLSLQNCEKELNWNRIVAQDELRASAVHEELVALEQQCSNNDNNNNDNATDVAVWRHMQQACTISEEERAEYLVELELTQTILGYVPHYYQDSAVLCAHRTMLLFQKFKQYPQRLDLLQQALSHCRALSTLSGGDYALSVRYEMWQTMLRPLFQEYLFGEQQQQQQQQQQQHNPDNEDDDEEDQKSNNSWIQTVGKAALIVLNLMEQSMNDDADNNNQKKDDAANKKRISETANNNNNDDNNNWPPFQPDQTLQLLSQKLRQVQLHGDAFDFHRILILGCMQSPNDGFSTLANAVGPDVFSQAFQPNSLCGMLSIPIAPVKTQVEAQMEFIQTAIAKRARSISTNSTHLDRIDGDVLEDLETLALLWSVDTRDVRTLFVLALYELGKDELFNSNNIILLQQQLLDVERLVDDGIVIICQRLTHAVLDPRVNPPIRNVLSQLDADLVEWIRAQGSSSTENTTTIQLKQHIPPLSYTHSFLLQLLRLSTCSETKQSLHSLSVLTGIILNELGNTV